jgi:hypothetical protein
MPKVNSSAFQKQIKQTKRYLSNPNFDSFEYETFCIKDHNSDCSTSGICRCGKVEISITFFDVTSWINSAVYSIKDPIIKYCIERILYLQKLTQDSFYPDVRRGYYGEEHLGFLLDDFHLVISKIDALEPLSDSDRVKHVLELEYNYLLDVFDGKNTVFIKEIDVNDIILNREYFKKLCDHNIYGGSYNGIRGVVVSSGEKYRLLDGYHRFFMAKKLGLKTIEVVVFDY